MLNKLSSFLRRYQMVNSGDHVICAVSGGADSVALLFAMYLLKEKLGIRLSAAHFNHCLRGEESDRDEAFVREFCGRYDIPLFVGSGEVKAGRKGLEAAARDARYAFLKGLPGKIATAHTADDNAETVLLHLVRGTGLKGLGGITPVSGNVIRPMLGLTRQDVEDFCEEWSLAYVTDSSNREDTFLRNRLRHHVMPILKQENPRLAESVSNMALRLRLDEEFIDESCPCSSPLMVEQVRKLHPAQRSRVLERFLKDCGIREPEAAHMAQAEALVFSEKPSAAARFPGGVTIARNYDRLEALREEPPLERIVLPREGTVDLPGLGLRIYCRPAHEIINTAHTFTVCPQGAVVLRAREAGDAIRLPGGTKSLKKLFIDKKIPASQRLSIPVIGDEAGVLGVYGFGVNLDRKAETLPGLQITFETLT